MDKKESIQERLKEIEALEKLIQQRKKELTDERPRTLQEILDSLPWKQFKNKVGEWTYATTSNGDLKPELKEIEAFIAALKKQGTGRFGRYEYRLTGKDYNFLNRYELGKLSKKKGDDD